MITEQDNKAFFVKMVTDYLQENGGGTAVPDNKERTLCLVLWAMCFGILEVVLDSEKHICGVGIARLCSGEPDKFNWQETFEGSDMVVDVIVCTSSFGKKELIKRLYYKYPLINRIFGFREKKGKLFEYKKQNIKLLYKTP